MSPPPPGFGGALTVTAHGLDVTDGEVIEAVTFTGPPAATPSTAPDPFTLATAVFAECHASGTTANVPPAAFFTTAVSVVVCPAVSDAEVGLTVIEAGVVSTTGASTVMTMAFETMP